MKQTNKQRKNETNKQTKKGRKKEAVQINFCQKNVEGAKSVNHSQKNIF